MLTKCPNCKEGEIDYSMSELHLITDSNPQEAGIEGLCSNSKCQTHIYIKFKEFQYEVTDFDCLLEDAKPEVINL